MKLAVITINSLEDYNQWKNYNADYISFVPANSSLDDDYFFKLVQVYIDRPAYRKISMVSPVVSMPKVDIYSWNITKNGYESTGLGRSRSPYAVQISYLPGAVIKKTALQKLNPTFTGDDMQDSINLSVALWNSGLRCFVDPDSAIEIDDNTLDDPFAYVHNEDELKDLREMFQREYIR